VHELKAMSKPFLNWSGKAERLSFDVPTLPLFIHERLSTKAILETLKGHKRDKQTDMFDLFGDPQHSITDQVLRAYEHKDKWVNRMILGDSLVVMNSLLHYENLGGQIQMIYLDPPYGVKFGSNFQPFVRKRDVSHNDDDDMTREPEMVQAYRDTWELGLHSYLTFLRDRFLLARDLLHHSGSIFVQINDGILHLVKAALDEIFEAKNAVAVIAFAKTSALGSTLLPATSDFLLWYARDKEKVKYHQLFKPRQERSEAGTFTWIELKDSTSRRLTKDETRGDVELPTGRRFRAADLTRMHWSEHSSYPFEFGGRVYRPAHTRRWATNIEGMQSLIKQNRIVQQGNSLAYKLYEDDFPLMSLDTVWSDTILGTFSEKFYVVQTSNLAVQRCILMTTDPGDLVLDPTCGSGTTAYCSEQWGRRWITVDTSRVPLALARQRLLTATYSWYELKDESRGPVAGLVYRRKQNNKGEEVGGIVPHVTLKSIANNEPPEEEVLVDRPESDSKITRVTGPFSFEATIPTPRDLEEVGSSSDSPGTAADGSFVDRMIEILRRTPVLRLEGNRTVTLKSVRPPAKSLSLSAEAVIANGAEKPVAFVFGPENGAVSEKLVYEAAREARAKNYTHLYVIGFAIQPNARELIEKCDS
jgi:adenine-specific DNA-methyltransferase